ncbi:hypothetical protein Pelo_4834 [Pelomyxa schiedti]|nr:hypothetical protein Pelo_4834 [Pelomyxa schiedti]
MASIDFTSLDHLGKYLQLLKRNSTLYEEYHAWRNQPFVGEFASLVEAQKMEGTDLLCSICRKAKEWNQTHTHPKVPPFQGCIKKFHKLFREP